MSAAKKSSNVGKDIRELLRGVHTGTHEVSFKTPELLGELGLSVTKAFRKAVTPEEKARPPDTFYASEIGAKCKRQLWYKYHEPSKAETPDASMSMKFMYGNIIEDVVLSLAELAGHKVTHRQHPVEHITRDGIIIRGRIDAIINNDTIIDVKSTSSFGFRDFKAGVGGEKFGYKEQLGFYYWYSRPPPSEVGYLAVDKQLGHIEYFKQEVPKSVEYLDLFKQLHSILSNPVKPVHPRLPTVTEGGNEKLGLDCSYCAFKHHCWRDANDGKGLRAFKYSNKVVWLASVKKEPKVPEITGAVLLGDAEETGS